MTTSNDQEWIDASVAEVRRGTGEDVLQRKHLTVGCSATPRRLIPRSSCPTRSQRPSWRQRHSSGCESFCRNRARLSGDPAHWPAWVPVADGTAGLTEGSNLDEAGAVRRRGHVPHTTSRRGGYCSR
jgi:hypothetical protein